MIQDNTAADTLPTNTDIAADIQSSSADRDIPSPALHGLYTEGSVTVIQPTM